MKSQLVYTLLLWNAFLFSESPTPLSFQEIKGGFNPAHYHEKQVEVRGFLYKEKSGGYLLADQPNLKSCCVGSDKKKGEQIQLKGEFTPPSAAMAITAQGQFMFDEKSKQLALIDPVILSKSRTFSNKLLFSIASAAALALFVYTRRKRF